MKEEFNEIYYKMLGAGFNKFVAREAALFYPTTMRKMFEESQERMLQESQSKCLTCGIACLPSILFCNEHVFAN